MQINAGNIFQMRIKHQEVLVRVRKKLTQTKYHMFRILNMLLLPKGIVSMNTWL